jgi:hypothetical protein
MNRGRRITFVVVGMLVLMAGSVGLIWTRFGGGAKDDPAVVEPAWDSDVDEFEEDGRSSARTWTLASNVAPLLSRYCGGCHSGPKPKGDFVLPTDTNPVADRAAWDRVAKAIDSGRMPPTGHPRPNNEEAVALAKGIGCSASDSSHAAAVPLRRLNRVEYDNTIRDLTGVSVRLAADFPADDTGDGFDTLGGVLSVSPTLVEKYLAAAERVVDAASRDPALWHRLTDAGQDDYIPFALRGTPPQRELAVKGVQSAPAEPAEAARTADKDRAYAALRWFADRAYRRPVTHAELTRLMHFVEGAINRGERADVGLKLAFQAVLASPHFLFKVEGDRAGAPGDDGNRLNDFELATRLSYFLWSRMPDDELFRLAAAGRLHESRVLVTEVRRMLKDPMSRALAENFAGQWLQTRGLPATTRDPATFPDFDAGLATAMRTETELFFDHVVREDRNVTELLTADYTFVNERLARHYGVPGITGNEFRRISLAGTGRAGLLTQAGVLTVTSGPTRTSPVKRGKWVLENLLGTPALAPPPGVDTLEETAAGRGTSLRERLKAHRSRSNCAACHDRLDPLGLVLEHYDAVGAWRDRDGDATIDDSGALPDGRTFRGPTELAALLAERPDEFIGCLTRKLMTYGLGRSLGPADRAAVDGVVRHANRNGYRFSSLIIALVRSEPFRSRSTQPEAAP